MRSTLIGILLALASSSIGCDDSESGTPLDASNEEDNSVTEDASMTDASEPPGCSDVCGSDEGVGGDLADNGVCEDGSEQAVSSVCSRGTDCTDCGPFECVPAGDQCSNHGDCCGFSSALGALCVDPDGTGGGEPICVPKCDAEHPCSEGFQCRSTTTEINVCVVN